jgi:tetratricopeptide (TPR) repeat protein
MITRAEQLMHNALVEQLRTKADGLLMHLREAAHLAVAPAERALDKADELAMEGRYEEALSELTRAIELDPKNASAFGARGALYADMHRNEEALDDLDRAIELDPEYGMCFAVRGPIYQEMGRYEEALADCNRAMELACR